MAPTPRPRPLPDGGFITRRNDPLASLLGGPWSLFEGIRTEFSNNAGEISAIYLYHALLWWVRDTDEYSSPVVQRRVNLITDSEYCV